MRYFVRMVVHAVRQAPPPSLSLIGASLGVVATLVILERLFPGRSGFDVFLAAFLVGSLIRLSSYLHRSQPHAGPSAIGAALIAAAVLATMHFQDPIWMQRVNTITSLIFVGLFASDLATSDFSLTRRYFSGADWVEIYPRLAWIRVVIYAGLAVANEIAIAITSPSGWLVYWAIMAPVMHYVWLASADIAYWTRPGAEDGTEV
ncbi:hypothetical protein AAD018_004125 [Aestuariibius insulae]|uniref:hypothetical protein n=1 Tax=Aestuariibius insulae TaxID=2058287 RepID=UPI00345E91FD